MKKKILQYLGLRLHWQQDNTDLESSLHSKHTQDVEAYALCPLTAVYC